MSIFPIQSALLDLLGAGGDESADGIGLVPSTNSIIPTTTTTNGKAPTPGSSNNQDLLDLLGGLDTPVSTPPAAIAPLGGGGGGIGLDLNSLNDNSIKAVTTSGTTPTATTGITGSSSFGGLENLLNSNLTSPTTTTAAVTIPTGLTSPTALINSSSTVNSLFSDFSSINNNEVWSRGDWLILGALLISIGHLQEHSKTLTALDKNGLLVQLLAKNSGGCLQIMMTAVNNSLTTLEQYLFQVKFTVDMGILF